MESLFIYSPIYMLIKDDSLFAILDLQNLKERTFYN